MTNDQPDRPAQPGIVVRRSRFDFAETVRRLDEQLSSRGLQVFARIDHAANAEHAGSQMAPTLVVLFGNAAAGTPLMVRSPDLALDLPLRVLVREDADGVVVVHRDPAALVGAFGLPADAAAPLAGVAAVAKATAGTEE